MIVAKTGKGISVKDGYTLKAEYRIELMAESRDDARKLACTILHSDALISERASECMQVICLDDDMGRTTNELSKMGYTGKEIR